MGAEAGKHQPANTGDEPLEVIQIERMKSSQGGRETRPGEERMSVKSICGAILLSADPEALARFYSQALGLSFEKEDHGGLATHWGVDIGRLHFGIHPPENFKRESAGRASVALTFDVTSVEQCQERLERLGARCLQPPHDEGFGTVASYEDPEGNVFEIVELSYDFDKSGG